jgi:hypothetical protein
VTSGLVGLVVAVVVELLACDVAEVVESRRDEMPVPGTAVVVLKEVSADISELLWFASGLLVSKHRQARQMRHRAVSIRVLAILSTYYLNRGLLMLHGFRFPVIGFRFPVFGFQFSVSSFLKTEDRKLFCVMCFCVF